MTKYLELADITDTKILLSNIAYDGSAMHDHIFDGWNDAYSNAYTFYNWVCTQPVPDEVRNFAQSFYVLIDRITDSRAGVLVDLMSNTAQLINSKDGVYSIGSPRRLGATLKNLSDRGQIPGKFTEAGIGLLATLLPQWVATVREQYTFEITKDVYGVYDETAESCDESCMAQETYPKWYNLNNDRIRIVRIRDVKNPDYVMGRALLWTTDQGVTVLDRVYPSNSGGHAKAIRKWAAEQGFICKERDALGSKLVGNPQLSLTDLKWDLKKYGMPYMDTFCYAYNFDKTKNTISLSNSIEYIAAQGYDVGMVNELYGTDGNAGNYYWEFMNDPVYGIYNQYRSTDILDANGIERRISINRVANTPADLTKSYVRGFRIIGTDAMPAVDITKINDYVYLTINEYWAHKDDVVTTVDTKQQMYYRDTSVLWDGTANSDSLQIVSNRYHFNNTQAIGELESLIRHNLARNAGYYVARRAYRLIREFIGGPIAQLDNDRHVLVNIDTVWPMLKDILRREGMTNA